MQEVPVRWMGLVSPLVLCVVQAVCTLLRASHGAVGGAMVVAVHMGAKETKMMECVDKFRIVPWVSGA